MKRVDTELRVTDAGVWFVVHTDEAAFREVLPGLAYQASDGAFERWFPVNAPDLHRIYRNFEQHIEELLEQTARWRRVPWEGALSELAARLDGAGIDWFVSGSAALAIRASRSNLATSISSPTTMIALPRLWLTLCSSHPSTTAIAAGSRRGSDVPIWVPALSGRRGSIPITTTGARRTRSGQQRQVGLNAFVGTKDRCSSRRSISSSPSTRRVASTTASMRSGGFSVNAKTGHQAIPP
jgi:hypothetical protein